MGWSLRLSAQVACHYAVLTRFARSAAARWHATCARVSFQLPTTGLLHATPIGHGPRYLYVSRLMNRSEMAKTINDAAEIIPRLHKAVHHYAANRGQSAYMHEKWHNACREFHEKYRELSFLGGWDSARERIRAGDQDALEYAIVFIEMRPYYFRSGYMFEALIKCLNSVAMSLSQRKRYEAVKKAFTDYKMNRRLTSR